MSGVEKDEDVTEVRSSSGDVYSAPIALGFEDDKSSSENGPVSINLGHYIALTSSPSAVYGPANCTDIEPSTPTVSNKDVREENGIRGRCGLYNLGNTCFMNSGLQCLMSTSPMVKFLLNMHQNSPSVDGSLLGQFRNLFAKVWSGQFSIVYPKGFKTTLGIYHTQFQDYRQHDCQEFLALLLDSLHEQLNLSGKSTNQNSEIGPSTSKLPITFEHNINNKVSLQGVNCCSDELSNDKSKNAVTSHSSLTFDNMKDSKTNRSPKSIQVAHNVRDMTESCKHAQNLIPFTINQISEDSNHSNISEHSSDSDQCSVMKNLKLRSSPTGSQSGPAVSLKITNDCGSKDCGVSSSYDLNSDAETVVNEVCSSEGFKRVHSLQDFRQKCEAETLTKASSDIDLSVKASEDIELDIEREFDTENIKLEAVNKHSGDIDNSADISTTCEEPVVLNNAKSTTSVPSLQDLYSKETKTLNTNVLATGFMDESVATDSDKFAKHDNTGERSETLDEEDILQTVHEVTNKNDNLEPKRVKDINIRADKKAKSPKGAAASGSMMAVEKEDCFALNSVKRMKFEGTEKNLQMQEICKIRKEVLLCEALHVNKTGNSNKGYFRKDASPSLESDIESDMVEDLDHEAEMEVSDDNDMEGDSEGPPPALVPVDEGALYTASEVMAAEEAWKMYRGKNDSVIVDTFQGQFKSTVVCAECNQVSVTFEPFMYLSVPVPKAMERQICVIFISRHCEPTQYLLSLHKLDKIAKLKQELCALIGQQMNDIIIAEVLDWHVSRILEDNTMLRYINDSSRQVYAFQMDQSCVGNLTQDSTASSTCDTTSADSQDSIKAHPDVFSDMDTFSATSTVTSDQSKAVSNSSSYYDKNFDQQDQFDYISTSNDLDIIGTGLWEWGQGASEKRRGSLETEAEDNWLPADSTTADAGGLNIAETVAKAIGEQTIEVRVNRDDKGMVSSSDTVEASSDWKSCAICLEELPETELMVHTTCGGTFCSTCLEMSVQHYSDVSYCCPVCSTPADITEDFVPLTNAASHKPKTRIVAIPIAYRCEQDPTGSMERPFLFAHPSMLNLPSNLTGEHIRSCIHDLHPELGDIRVLLTDGTGLKCSRCLYMEHCTGCEIPPNGEAILRPGDHLTVSMATVTHDLVARQQVVVNHKSLENKHSNDPLTLLDCFSAFTQSEELDEHNPWFCPHCEQNQQAKKTMTVWQYPDTLIIQLKRFVFHELSSTKVDNKVIFPVDGLDLNDFITGPVTKNLVYNLYSLVCHFGGANSGHYTSYAKHPVDGKWYYYNDETVTESGPGEEEFSSTYVLFYQRRGTDKALQIPDDLEIFVEADGSDPMTSCLPSVHFTPPEGDITLDDTSKTPTSCHTVAPSTGSCDLSVENEAEQRGKATEASYSRETTVADSQHSVKAELAEADSTEGTYEFYS